ncbi:hypothetical protein EJ04DRAFT_603104 [Polyplosphaeria fusca]|uniref:Uncharacterized protein n=1 Tax=Polyplosphaeria fusca TaxID=682080 RepID=A0A9P4V3K6_9PLEO|nr:hypothetical protein EJ04DRAFT_603104 [Polyplosphaeria fusca]
MTQPTKPYLPAQLRSSILRSPVAVAPPKYATLNAQARIEIDALIKNFEQIYDGAMPLHDSHRVGTYFAELLWDPEPQNWGIDFLTLLWRISDKASKAKMAFADLEHVLASAHINTRRTDEFSARLSADDSIRTAEQKVNVLDLKLVLFWLHLHEEAESCGNLFRELRKLEKTSPVLQKQLELYKQGHVTAELSAKTEEWKSAAMEWMSIWKLSPIVADFRLRGRCVEWEDVFPEKKKEVEKIEGVVEEV